MIDAHFHHMAKAALNHHKQIVWLILRLKMSGCARLCVILHLALTRLWFDLLIDLQHWSDLGILSTGR
jgi:hypothetical protein